jgi:hypothetical protein
MLSGVIAAWLDIVGERGRLQLAEETPARLVQQLEEALTELRGCADRIVEACDAMADGEVDVDVPKGLDVKLELKQIVAAEDRLEPLFRQYVATA